MHVLEVNGYTLGYMAKMQAVDTDFRAKCVMNRTQSIGSNG